jgi:hypothetical protein
LSNVLFAGLFASSLEIGYIIKIKWVWLLYLIIYKNCT